MKEIENLKKILKQEEYIETRRNKAFNKLDRHLESKFMWDLKIIDKMRISVDPWNKEVDIFPVSAMRVDDNEIESHSGTIGGGKCEEWSLKISTYKDFLKVRPDYMQEVTQWAYDNIIKYFQAEIA